MEHIHYGPLIAGGNADGMKLYRIHDGGGRNPFDIGGACVCGLGVAIEVKVSHVKTPVAGIPIDWKAFQPQQPLWLKSFAEVGSLSIVATYFETLRLMRFVSMKSVTDFEPGWSPPPEQRYSTQKINGVYPGMRSLCLLCKAMI